MKGMSPSPMQFGTRCVVSVPASTSNIGPGFDGIGCAVDLRNEFEFELLPPGSACQAALSGNRCAGITTSANNLAITTAQKFFRMQGQLVPSFSLRAKIEVPNARGLGSSSTAIVAGIVAGNALLGNPLTEAELLDLAVELEGHPDNVAPALLGGLIIGAAHSKPLSYFRLAVHEDVRFVFLIPDYEVKTADARAVLPKTIPHADGIFNASRTPIVVLSLTTGNLAPLASAIEDKLHQPYRKQLFKGYDEFAAAAMGAGAAGFCVSGAGSTMLAVVSGAGVDSVSAALKEALQRRGENGDVVELRPTPEGTRVATLP